MLHKFWRCMFAAALAVTFTVGCAGQPDPVKEDLLYYLEEIEPLGREEQEITDNYARVTGKNYEDDETFLRMLEEKIIPGTGELLEEMNRIEPETGEVSRIHDLYKKGWKNQKEAFRTLEEALKEQDRDKVDEGNALLEKASSRFKRFSEELHRLAEEYDLEL